MKMKRIIVLCCLRGLALLLSMHLLELDEKNGRQTETISRFVVEK